MNTAVIKFNLKCQQERQRNVQQILPNKQVQELSGKIKKEEERVVKNKEEYFGQRNLVLLIKYLEGKKMKMRRAEKTMLI
jgi:hypothetical protein